MWGGDHNKYSESKCAFPIWIKINDTRPSLILPTQPDCSSAQKQDAMQQPLFVLKEHTGEHFHWDYFLQCVFSVNSQWFGWTGPLKPAANVFTPWTEPDLTRLAGGDGVGGGHTVTPTSTCLVLCVVVFLSVCHRLGGKQFFTLTPDIYSYLSFKLFLSYYILL